MKYLSCFCSITLNPSNIVLLNSNKYKASWDSVQRIITPFSFFFGFLHLYNISLKIVSALSLIKLLAKFRLPNMLPIFLLPMSFSPKHFAPKYSFLIWMKFYSQKIIKKYFLLPNFLPKTLPPKRIFPPKLAPQNLFPRKFASKRLWSQFLAHVNIAPKIFIK